MSHRKRLPTTHRLVLGPDFANSTRLHSTPLQRRPVNRSTGPRFHSAPLHRLKSSKTGSPGVVRAKAFVKSHQPAGRASGPCRNFRPHSAPKISLTSAIRASHWPYACPPPTRRRPASPPAVRSQPARPRARTLYSPFPYPITRACHVSCPPVNPA